MKNFTIRQRQEEREQSFCSEFACLSQNTRGRDHEVEPCAVRTAFQRDIDRIAHSKAFRRLKHKTQVFLLPEGDHYRTRMTHTLEVSRIARTIARGLDLNEDLTEAIALGHDLGHTPFGHAGEFVLRELMGETGFAHNEQSVRTVTRLEDLNLTYEVKNGIVCHTGKTKASTLEGQVVALSDRIAYINHDIQDALRAGILEPMDLPLSLTNVLGADHGSRINCLSVDVITESQGKNGIYQSSEVGDAMLELREFMFKHVYTNPLAKGEETKAQDMLRLMFHYYMEHSDDLPVDYQHIVLEEGVLRAVCDYIAGMTDSYATQQYLKLFVPKGWHK